MYRDKREKKVAIIDAVVDLLDPKRHSLKWSNISGTKESFISSARAKLKKRRPGVYPTRVFLLGTLHDTDFRKDTRGGMQSSKQYFDVGPLGASDAPALAAALSGKNWSARTRILRDAFEAHRSQKYTLSVPSMLAQADGIGSEIIDSEQFFSNRRRRKSFNRVMTGIDLQAYTGVTDRICVMQLCLLRMNLAVSRSTQMATSSPLNRHGVLHGIDVDYPIEANSLRAAMLLGYLVSVHEAIELIKLRKQMNIDDRRGPRGDSVTRGVGDEYFANRW